MPAPKIAHFPVILFLFAGFSAAADIQWSDNFSWNRARVITPEQQIWSFRTSYQQFNSRFTSFGTPESLGRPFDRTWTYQQLLSTSTSAADVNALRKYMSARGAKPSDLAAATTFDLTRTETTFNVAWAYGLTSRWMIGVQAPITMIDTQLKSDTSLSPGLSQIARRNSSSELPPPREMKRRVASMVQNQLVAQGYDQLRTRTQNVVVDNVSIMSQVGVWQNPDWAFSLQPTVQIPAAPNTNVADYVRFSRGNGQIDVGMTALLDYQWRRFLFGVKGGYLAQLPDTQKMRVPVTDGDSHGEMIDASVRRDLGDIVTASFETFYDVSRSWKVNAAYLGYFKGADRFSGTSSEAQYWELGNDSAESLHVARAGASYVLGTPSSRHDLEHKWVTNFNVYQPIAGRNISSGPEASFELQTLF